MKLAFIAFVLALPATAAAEDGFVQGIAGYSSPIAGDQYTEGVNGGARVGLRGGWAPLHAGNAAIGFEVGADWRPLTTNYGEHVQQMRALVGPRITFAAANHEVFFRAAIGYDHLYLSDNVNDTGLALEPGFGAAYRIDKLLFGAEIAVPVAYHQSSEYMDGFAGADIEVMLSVGSRL